MTEESVQHCARWISSRTGLRIRREDREKFERVIRQRIALHRLSDPEAYLEMLQARAGAGSAELEALVPLLTTGETYFFRDRMQHHLLRETLVPELIERRKDQRSLRLWSAGCSTGEEAYSLAIILDQLLGGDAWDIFILGTDINQDALKQAKEGVYKQWSLRIADRGLVGRYFRERAGEWVLNERIRKMVHFRPCNLVRDIFPGAGSGVRDMDVIVCRNVFLYLDHHVIAEVARKFAACLRPGGYLLTGHHEPISEVTGFLRSKFFPESVVYHRDPIPQPDQWDRPRVDDLGDGPWPAGRAFDETWGDGEGPLSARNQPAPVESPKPLATSQARDSLWKDAQTSLRHGDYAAAMRAAGHLLEQQPRHFDGLCLMARSYANLGRHPDAARYCRAAMGVNPLGALPHFLLAHVEEEQGRVDEAMASLKKALYLQPSFAVAQIDLAGLYQIRGDFKKARQNYEAALNLLERSEPDALVEPYGEMTACDMTHSVRAMLEGASA